MRQERGHGAASVFVARLVLSAVPWTSPSVGLHNDLGPVSVPQAASARACARGPGAERAPSAIHGRTEPRGTGLGVDMLGIVIEANAIGPALPAGLAVPQEGDVSGIVHVVQTPGTAVAAQHIVGPKHAVGKGESHLRVTTATAAHRTGTAILVIRRMSAQLRHDFLRQAAMPFDTRLGTLECHAVDPNHGVLTLIADFQVLPRSHGQRDHRRLPGVGSRSLLTVDVYDDRTIWVREARAERHGDRSHIHRDGQEHRPHARTTAPAEKAPVVIPADGSDVAEGHVIVVQCQGPAGGS